MTEEQQDDLREDAVEAPVEAPAADDVENDHENDHEAAGEYAGENDGENDEDSPADAPAPDDGAETVTAGHPAVDEVLRSLDALQDAPVDEHVAVFEQAHEQLRRTLQSAGDE